MPFGSDWGWFSPSAARPSTTTSMTSRSGGSFSTLRTPAPIAGSNAYGPLHNLLALLLPLGDVVPKFAIIGVFAVASGLLLDRLIAESAGATGRQLSSSLSPCPPTS